MIKVAICDDDIQFIYKLEQSIFRFAEMKRIKVDVDGYTSGAEFIQKLQQSESYHLLFLDIEIENEADLIAMLKKISPFFKWDGLLHVLEGEKFL